MQFWEHIKVGNKVELIPLENKGKKEHTVYLSKIQDIPGTGTIDILMPMEKGKRHLVSKLTKHIVIIYTSVGIFEGEGIVAGRYQAGTVFLLRMKMLSRLFKRQRREFYRLQCERPVQYRKIEEREEEIRKKLREDNFQTEEERLADVHYLLDLDIKSEWNEAIMLDLSAGGLRVKLPKEGLEGLEGNLMFRLNLFIEGDVRPFEVECAVVSSADVQNESKMKEVRCKYLHLTNHRQEMLARYVFDQQCKQRALSYGN